MLPDSILLSSVFGLGISILIAGLGYSFIRTGSGFGRFVASRSPLTLSLVTVLYIAWWWFYGVMRHLNFQTLIGDEGTFMNIFWNTLHGRPFATELWYGNFFSTHFEPSLLFIALLWAPWQSQIWLAGLQTMICAVGALGAYGIARKLDLSPPISLLFGLIWLGNLSMRGIISVDFHGIIVVAALIVWVPLLMLNKRHVWAMVLAFVLMNFKEDATVYLGGLGVIMALSYGEKRWGWILVGSSIIYYMLVHNVLWNLASASHLDYFALRFPNLIHAGKSSLEVILADPLRLIYSALAWDRLWGLVAIFAPVLFLPFLRWGWLGLLPALWILFTMSLYSIHVFSGYYAGVVFNLILIAAIPGLVRWHKSQPARTKPTAWLMFGFLMGSWFMVQPVESFSYINTANLQPHPQTGFVQKVAEETPENVSVSSDKFIGSYFANRRVLRYFPDPEDLLGARIYITNRSLCHPLTVLAIGSLGYGLVAPNPCFMFLGRGEGSDASAEFMDRLRWTEAEGASTALWATEPDSRASRGSAIHIAPGTGYGDVVVSTNKLALPPGDYAYSITVRKDEKCIANVKLPVEVRFIKPDGGERTMRESMLTVGSKEEDCGGYKDLTIPFTVAEAGLVYLNINFGSCNNVWWDGVGLTGLNMNFEDYYRYVFPAEVTPARQVDVGSISRTEEPKFADSLIVVGNLESGQTVFGWLLDERLPAGEYWIYYSADVVEDGDMDLTWAEMVRVPGDQGAGSQQPVIPLTFVRRRGCHDIQLNHSSAPVALAPGDRLEIRAYAGLPATVSLKGIWLLRPVVTDYLLYLR